MWQGALGVRFTFDVKVFVEHFVTKKTALLGLEQKNKIYFFLRWFSYFNNANKEMFSLSSCSTEGITEITIRPKAICKIPVE